MLPSFLPPPHTTHRVRRLAEDHVRAARLAAELRDLPFVERVAPVETNIVSNQAPPSPLPLLCLHRRWRASCGPVCGVK